MRKTKKYIIQTKLGKRWISTHWTGLNGEPVFKHQAEKDLLSAQLSFPASRYRIVEVKP